MNLNIQKRIKNKLLSMTNSSYIQIKCQLLEKKKNNVENLYYSREVKEGSDFFLS